MTTRKRNEYLDLPSDDEGKGNKSTFDRGYDSEERENKAARASGPKRRKVVRHVPLLGEGDEESEGSEDVEGEDAANEDDTQEARNDETLNEDIHEANEHEDADADADADADEDPEDGNSPAHTQSRTTKPPQAPPNPSTKPTTKRELKTGIIYLPTLPPYLKPHTLRTLLAPYTKYGISRLFLTPEPTPTRRARLSRGGNRKTLYVDGWVEFHSKSDAKTVVDACNGNIVGGKKGGYYRDDVWSMRYLSGFKWGDLVGERRDEEAERASRLDAERRREKREREGWLRAVGEAKVEDTREEKRRRKVKEGEVIGEVAGGDVGDGGRRRGQRLQTFRQNEVKWEKDKGDKGAANGSQSKNPSEDVQKVLQQIF